MGLYLLLTLLLFFLAGTYLADVIVVGINIGSLVGFLSYFLIGAYLTWEVNYGRVPRIDLVLSATSFLVGFGLRRIIVGGG